MLTMTLILAAALPIVSVDGTAFRVEAARCSAMPVNIRWPGNQRELDQTEICSFARFDCRGATEVRVAPNRPFTNVVVRPVAAHVSVVREGDAVRFTLPKTGAYSVEFDGRHENLMLFADPPHEWNLDRTAPGVRYFGPGEHDVGLITLQADETLFLDEGAVVYGRIFAKDAPNVRICGTGILDASRVKEEPIAIDPKLAEEQRKKGWAITNVERFDAIRLMFCDNVRIEGITIRDSQIYAVRPICCDNLTVENVKILGSWRYNSDGIDMHNCRKVRIRDSFIRTFDDSICVKGFDYILPEAEMLHDGVLHDVFEDVLVERCTIWNDWGRALEIGAETRAREIRNVTFRDCDILAFHGVALDVQNCDQAYVHDIVYERIRVECDPDAPETAYSASAKDFRPDSRCAPPPLAVVVIHYIPEYSKAGAANRGRVSDVTFRDIDVVAPILPPGSLTGFDAEHRVECVTFDRIRLNGRDMTKAFRSAVVTNAFVSSGAAERLSLDNVPVRRGGVEGRPYWNAHSIMFLYPPAFEFKTVSGATGYRFDVLDDLHVTRSFVAETPTVDLSPVWPDLPIGYVTVTVTAVDGAGKDLAVAGRRTFWRKAGFKEGTYSKAQYGYGECAAMIFENLRTREASVYLSETGKLQDNFENRYPTKMLSGLIMGMVHYAVVSQAKKAEALTLAGKAADCLIALSEKADARYPSFPPTYNPSKYEANYEWPNRRKCMTQYPAFAANSYLSLFEATGEVRYREAAKAIGETYLAFQGEDGTWPLMVHFDEGPTGANRLMPLDVATLMDRIFKLTGDARFRTAGDKAFAYIEKNLIDTWNWEGQFEDTPPTDRYRNLTMHPPCSTAIYLLDRYPGDTAKIALARELLRFAEDQFVNWERPYDGGRRVPDKEKFTGYYNRFWEQDKWIMPSVMEQYGCFAPVDGSAAKLIRTYLALYKAEGNLTDLEKAEALADTATRMTSPDGLEATWWSENMLRADIWPNCMSATASALSELAEIPARLSR